MFVADIYESDRLENRIQVSVTPSDRPLILVLSGFLAAHWVIDNPSQREIAGIVLMGGQSAHIVSSVEEVPILQSFLGFPSERIDREIFMLQHFDVSTYSLFESYNADVIEAR